VNKVIDDHIAALPDKLAESWAESDKQDGERRDAFLEELKVLEEALEPLEQQVKG
jgi:hypothetical protein